MRMLLVILGYTIPVFSCFINVIEYNYFRLSRVRESRSNGAKILRRLQRNLRTVQKVWLVRMGKMLCVSYAAC